MYLAHVAVGRQYLQVARLFGRDRTTVMSACAQVEDRRDDPAFDAHVTALEQLLNADADATEFANAA
jgi:chromosomal replication initiation ATPase DnaA